MKLILCLLFIAPILCRSQGNGIQFIQKENWQQVLAKAKAEHKYIFVDCFATWCGPCKEMDRNIYPQKDVGYYFNLHFISIKIQMDTSREDNESIKGWYASAHQIRQDYKVSVLPTFLFFSSEGILIHKDVGAKDTSRFIALGKSALDPQTQYYTLVDNYKKGKKYYPTMSYLAHTAKLLGDNVMAQDAANDYSNYLSELNDSDLYKKENIRFIAEFMHSSRDKGFWMFYHHRDKIDKIMENKTYSEDILDYVISKEEIYPLILSNRKPIEGLPDWNSIAYAIKRKYEAQYADRTIIKAKIGWYEYKKEWKEFCKYTVLSVERVGMDTTGIGRFNLNHNAWMLFLHSGSEHELNTALSWMKMILAKSSNWVAAIDTYANLLYKLGRTHEALLWEQKAAKLAPNDKDIQQALKKMLDGDPTWASDEE